MTPDADADTVPVAVLLDAGGVFVLPEPARIVGAFTRAECEVDGQILDDVHYRAAQQFAVGLDVEENWAECWLSYLQAYVVECGVPEDRRAEALRWGEDYELLFTLPAGTEPTVSAWHIGEVRERGETALLLDGGEPEGPLGYEHGRDLARAPADLVSGRT